MIILTIITYHLEFSIPDDLGGGSRIELLPVTMAGDVMHVYLRASLEDLSSVLPDKNPVDSYAYELRKSLVRTYRMKIPILQMMIELVGS